MWDIPALVTAGMKILDKFIPDIAERDKAKHELEIMLIQASTMQQQINMKEAEHASVFVAGWRPAAGWMGVLGMAYAFFFQPIFTWASLYMGGPAFPNVETEVLLSLLFGMLGLGTMRSYEKVKEVARDNGIRLPQPIKAIKRTIFGEDKSGEVTQYRD